MTDESAREILEVALGGCDRILGILGAFREALDCIGTEDFDGALARIGAESRAERPQLTLIRGGDGDA